jgi:predicted nucleic acid-binding protein
MKPSVCVDSSVWIEHFRGNTTALKSYLDTYPFAVKTHELIILELALGGMVNKEEKISLIRSLNTLPNATCDEVLAMIGSHGLVGKGIGCVDSHILASCLFTDTLLWTNDRKLAKLADGFHLLYNSEAE